MVAAYLETNVGNIKKLGGNDGWHLTKGDWTQFSDGCLDYAIKWPIPIGMEKAKGKALGCSYSYRGLPAPRYGLGVTGGIKPSDLANDTEKDKSKVYENGQTNPTQTPSFPDVVRLWSMCPPRKTQKLLGGRSIVLDRVGNRGWTATTEAADGVLDPYPGDGILGHREDYNVLYGDWHANWYGDPQERWIWITNHAGRSNLLASNRHAFTHGAVSNGIQMWLYFDQAAGFAQDITIAWSPW